MHFLRFYPSALGDEAIYTHGIDLVLRKTVPLALPVPTTHLSLRSILTTSPVIAVNDIGSAADFLAAIEGTIRNFNDGDLVEGTVVQVDREEVLVDIGYQRKKLRAPSLYGVQNHCNC